MAAPDPNPYESPQTITTEPRASQITPFLRLLLRLTTLSFAGFASFFTIGLLFVAVAESFELDIFPSIRWAMGMGVLGAVLFLCSEVFNSGKSHQAGFIARFIASIAVFIVSGFINAFVGPRPQLRSEETDPYEPQRTLILIGILISTFALARLLWIGHRDPKAK